MTDWKTLCRLLASHMAHMQGQLEALHEVDNLEDFYWYQESEALRMRVAAALAAGLKEQASESLDKVVECLKMLVPGASVDGVHIETIRRALEALPDD